MSKLSALLLIFLAIGCGAGQPLTDSSPMSTARQMLEEIAKSGSIADHAKKIEAEFDKMKHTDGAKANQLLKQFNQLKAMKEAEKIKTAAGNLAAQL